jgi:methylenetetrahydrofolate dehydrogenase (NADP+)/methenyltetrahydrofolate cyclohydrolase
MKKIEGNKIAQEILDKLKMDIPDCTSAPGLAAVLVGENEASKLYLSLKEKAAQKVGINFYDYFLHTHMSQQDIEDLIYTLNQDEYVDGILVQLPLPNKYDKKAIIESIDPNKDVDGLHSQNQANFLKSPKEYLLSPFPKAILRLMEASVTDLHNKKVAILANSKGFGEFMSMLLNEMNITSDYILADDVGNKKHIIQEADIIITALGKPGFITADMIKEQAIIIDGGIEKVDGAVCGDVDEKSVSTKAQAITSVPGGVGPVTVACLMENVYQAAKKSEKCPIKGKSN